MIAPRARLVAALAVVLATAFAVRTWRLQEVPQVTDESAEVLFAWRIAFEGARPLTHTDSYNGPLWPYLMAGALRTAGPSVELPRRFTLAFSLAAVAAAFALGTVVAGARVTAAATVAGLVMAANYTHGLVGSRVAWSNSTTPFWTAVATWALLLAVREPASVPRWAAAGLLAGLALNTHPSVSAYLAGLGVWYLLDGGRRAGLRTRGPWIAVVAALVAYAPVLVHNLSTRGDSLIQAAASRNVESAPGLSWPANVGAMAVQFGRSLGGGFAVDGRPVWGVGALVFTAAAAWLLVTAAAAHERGLPGRRLPLVVVVCCALVLPVVNRNWDGFLEARYLAFLVPLIGAAAAVAVTAPAPAWRRTLAAAGTLCLVVVPTFRVAAHVEQATAGDRHNGPLLAMVDDVRAAQQAGALVLVEDDLKGLAWPNRGDPRRAVTYYLTLAGIPHDVASGDKIHHLVASEGRNVAAFLVEADVARIGGGRLQPVRVIEPVESDPAGVRDVAGYPAWGLYATDSSAGAAP